MNLKMDLDKEQIKKLKKTLSYIGFGTSLISVISFLYTAYLENREED